jgi:hypothetical protein
MAEGEAAFARYVEGFGPDCRVAEFEDHDAESVRFDECLPASHLTNGGSPSCLSSEKGTNFTSPIPAQNRETPLWQVEFWTRQTIFKNTVAAKLREAGRPDLANTLEDCHSSWTVALCGDCGAVRKFPNRCDSFFCPECQPRLSGERKKAVEWWTKLVTQPKHVVLTVRNLPELTKGHVQEFKRWFSRLRRRAFARNWQGGFYSLEVTNEGAGWHLHLHALIDAKWIDAAQLSREWCAVTGGAGYIVKVKDARREDYLAELVKYAVKGSDLAKWSGNDIVTFITAFLGVRSFGVFGSLYAARTRYAEFIATIRDAKPLCDCGSCNIRYYSEAEWLERDFKPTIPQPPKPPKPTGTQVDLFAGSHSTAHALAAIAR